jgi:hypothetical protein
MTGMFVYLAGFFTVLFAGGMIWRKYHDQHKYILLIAAAWPCLILVPPFAVFEKLQMAREAKRLDDKGVDVSALKRGDTIRIGWLFEGKPCNRIVSFRSYDGERFVHFEDGTPEGNAVPYFLVREKIA